MKHRILAANVQPYDTLRGAVVASVVGDSASIVYVSAYRPDGTHTSWRFPPRARVTVHRNEGETS